MSCSICVHRYGSSANGTSNLKGQNSFLLGSSNFRITAVTDHESSVAHKKAAELDNASARSESDILLYTSAGKALQSLKQAER
jgi:hypothetical protein